MWEFVLSPTGAGPYNFAHGTQSRQRQREKTPGPPEKNTPARVREAKKETGEVTSMFF